MDRGTDVTDAKRDYKTAVKENLPENFIFELVDKFKIRYGENPNQSGAIYKLKGNQLAEAIDIRTVKSGKDGLSATNSMDIARAGDILKYFNVPAISVMKHLNPSGFSRQFNGNELSDIYLKARDTDKQSAFGSVVVLNRPLDKATAEAIHSTYVEVVAAPSFEEGTLDIFHDKEDLRVVVFSGMDKIPKFIGDNISGLYDIRVLPTGRVLVQEPYLSSIKGPQDLIFDPFVTRKDQKYMIERDPTPTEIADLLDSWYINIGVRSNAIVIFKDGTTLGVGTGKQERVRALNDAIILSLQKAMDREGIPYDPIDGAAQRNLLSYNPLEGAVMSSDAFFPQRDSIDTAAKHGIKSIIQPFGSKKDYEIIQAANEHGMSMACTLERCFRHF